MKLASCYSSFELTVTLRGQIQCRRARFVLLVVCQSPVITLNDDSCFRLSEVCIPGGLRVCCAFGLLVGDDNAHGFSSISSYLPNNCWTAFNSVSLLCLLVAKYHTHDHSPFLLAAFNVVDGLLQPVSLLCLLVAYNNAHDHSPFLLTASKCCRRSFKIRLASLLISLQEQRP